MTLSLKYSSEVCYQAILTLMENPTDRRQMSLTRNDWGKADCQGFRRKIRALFRFTLGWLAVGLVLPLAAAQARDLASEITTYLEAWAGTERFMGTVLVARNDAVVFEGSYGLADSVGQVPTTSATAFRLGSLSKPLTATAVLQLQEVGLLSIDDPLSNYLAFPHGEAITLRHLLTHSSGLPDYARLPDYRTYMSTPTALSELVDKLRSLPLLFPPGTQFAYSNSNYVLLSAVIEKVAGQAYGTYMQKHLFDVAGMASSRYGEPPDSVGYRLTDDGIVPASAIDLSVAAGAGGLSSTAHDLYAWLRALRDGVLLEPATLQTMLSPEVPVGPSSSGGRAFYGLGVYVSDYLGRRLISHDGGVNGYSSSLLWFPDDDAAIIVLSNLDAAPVPEISRGLAALLFGAPYEVPEVYQAVRLAPEVLQSYEGRYALGPAFVVEVQFRDGYLYLEPEGGPSLRLYPYADDHFFLKVVDLTLRFVTADGAVRGLVWQQGERVLQGRKLE